MFTKGFNLGVLLYAPDKKTAYEIRSQWLSSKEKFLAQRSVKKNMLSVF